MPRRSRRGLPYLVFAAGLIGTAVSASLVHRSAEQQDRAAFDADVRLARATVERRISSYINLVRATGQGFYLTDKGGPATFYKFMEGLELKENYPGIRGVGASIRLPIDVWRRAGLLGQLYLHVPGYQLWPLYPRREYHTIFAIYPLDKWNKRAIGYDMHTEIVRADAMDRARDSGKPAASGTVVLVQDENDQPQPAFLIYSPLYAAGKIPPVRDRNRLLIGYAYAPFRMKEAFGDIVREASRKTMQVRIDDVTNGENPLYRTWKGSTDLARKLPTRYETNVVIPVADRRWRFTFYATPGYAQNSGAALVAVISVSGAALSFLLLGIMLYQERAQRALEERQRNIEVLNERLRRAMRETHHRVKNNLQVIAAMIDMHAMEAEPESEKELRQLGRHVAALATVHDILTEQAGQAGDTQHISARMVLEKLLPMLEPLTLGRPLVRRLDDALLSSRQGTSLAIVTNELVSNAIKHGRGPIEVTFSVRDGTADLLVADDGPGFPPDFSVEQSSSTGLHLVESLSSWDLGGGVRFGNRPEGGARVTVKVALETARN